MEPKSQETRSIPRNRKCGNCRYFEPAPLWRKGWCRNPQLYPPHANHLVESATIDCEGGFRSRIYWEPIPAAEVPYSADLHQPNHLPEPIRPLGASFKPKTFISSEPIQGEVDQFNFAEPIEISQRNPFPVEQLEPVRATDGWRVWLRQRLPFTEKLPLEKINPMQVLPWALAALLLLIALIVLTSNGGQKNNTAADTARDKAVATQNAILSNNLTITPSAAKTPSTPATSSTAVSEKLAVVTGIEASETLNLRKEPSVTAAVVKSLKLNSKLKVLEGPKLAEGFEWYKVDFEGQVGWVVKKYLSFS